MIFRTHNTVYTLVDRGDGAFEIYGHAHYCPTPTPVTLDGPVEVGKSVRFSYINKCDQKSYYGSTVTTTPVVSII